MTITRIVFKGPWHYCAVCQVKWRDPDEETVTPCWNCGRHPSEAEQGKPD